MLDPQTGYDERLMGADPRDAVIDAELALWGVIDLLTEQDRAVDRRGIEAILRLIHVRLEPAAHSLQHFRAPAT